MKKRLLNLIKIYLSVSAIMIAYAIFFNITGIGIPCVFRLITHLNCPGCGISRFALSCLKFRFADAIIYNYFAPFIIVYIAWVVIYTSINYVRTGSKSLNPKPAWINIVFLILVIIWGVVRNILNI